MSMERLTLPKSVDEVSIDLHTPNAYDKKAPPGPQGVHISYGWTVALGIDEIKRYLSDFARDPLGGTYGGFHSDGKIFVISQGKARLMLDPDQGARSLNFSPGTLDRKTN